MVQQRCQRLYRIAAGIQDVYHFVCPSHCREAPSAGGTCFCFCSALHLMRFSTPRPPCRLCVCVCLCLGVTVCVRVCLFVFDDDSGIRNLSCVCLLCNCVFACLCLFVSVCGAHYSSWSIPETIYPDGTMGPWLLPCNTPVSSLAISVSFVSEQALYAWLNESFPYESFPQEWSVWMLVTQCGCGFVCMLMAHQTLPQRYSQQLNNVAVPQSLLFPLLSYSGVSRVARHVIPCDEYLHCYPSQCPTQHVVTFRKVPSPTTMSLFRMA